MSTEFTFTFPLADGLHARPASALEEIARTYAAEITLVNERTGRQASLRSVLGMVGTDTRREDRCRIVLQGADEQEALKTISAFVEETLPHCDEVLPSQPHPAGEIRLPPCLRDAGATVWRGTSVVGGIGRGRIVQIGGFVLPSVPVRSGTVDAPAEQKQVIEALEALDRNYDGQLTRAAGKTATDVLKAHRSIARDPDFKSRLLAIIQEKQCTAMEALADTQAHFTAMLMAAGSVLLRERAMDVQDVCRQLAKELCGSAVESDEIRLEGDSIVLAESLTPSRLLEMDRRHLKGLVLAHAGNTSHTAILARSFGIPTVTGVLEAATAQLQGAEAVLDGELGLLATKLTEPAKRYYSMEQRRLERRSARMRRFADRPGRTVDGVGLEIAANISTAYEVTPAIAAGAEGVGLFRTEMLFMERAEAPTEEEQFDAYRNALKAAKGKPVIIRTLDVGADKPLPYLDLPAEENPFLGCRGVRLYPRIENLFRTQVRALLRASTCGQLRVMIPMVGNLAEARWVKKIAAEERARLEQQGVSLSPSIPLGAMVEVPSAAFELGALCRELDFFSIGSNDMLHYFTATDRSNESAAVLCHPTAPQFLRLLKKIVDEVHAGGKWIGLCGEMGGQSRCLPLLVGLGLDEISVSARSIPRIKAELQQMSAADCRRLIGQSLECETYEEVESLLQQQMAPTMPPLLETDLLIMDSDATSRAEAIKEICDSLYVTGRTDNPREVEEAVWSREAVYSTGFGHGFAIPHCKTKAVSVNSLSVLKSRHPIPWQAADGQPVNVVILLAIRESDQATEHMKIFSRLARKLMHDDFRARLTSEQDPSALLAFLSEQLEMKAG